MSNGFRPYASTGFVGTANRSGKVVSLGQEVQEVKPPKQAISELVSEAVAENKAAQKAAEGISKNFERLAAVWGVEKAIQILQETEEYLDRAGKRLAEVSGLTT